MALLQPPSFLQNRTDHTAQEDRLYLQGIMNPGVGGLSIPLVRAQASPNMSVIVAKERFFINGTESTTQGMYHGYNDADLTVTIAASSPTLSRTDLVCAYIQDAFYSGANNQLVVDKVTGTAGGGVPSAPANAIILAQIAVAANATTVTNANITMISQIAAPVIDVPDVFTNQAAATAAIPLPTQGTQVWLTAPTASDPGLFAWTGTVWQRVSPLTQSSNSGTFTILNTTNSISGTVTFPTAFVAAPAVMAITTVAGNYACNITAITTTNFTIRLYRTDGGNVIANTAVPFNWVAFGAQ